MRDVRELHRPVARTRVLRAFLVAGTVALLAGAVAAAGDLDPRDRGLLPRGTSGVVVLDLSLSILDDRSGVVRQTLRRLIEADDPVGLVVFSDVAYELLPPGTPAAELKPIVRLLTPTADGDAVTPWTDAFRFGTKVSTALLLARDMLRRDEVAAGSVLLVSDLETAPDDVPPTVRALRDLDRAGVAVRLLALGPSSDARELFGGILGPEAFTALDEDPGGRLEPAGAPRRPLPWLLLVLGALFLLGLFAHERYGARLALPTPSKSAGA